MPPFVGAFFLRSALFAACRYAGPVGNPPACPTYCNMTMGPRQKANFCACGSSTLTWQV